MVIIHVAISNISCRRIFSESFEYVPDAKIRSTLVVAPLFSAQLYDQNAINDIKISLSRPADRM